MKRYTLLLLFISILFTLHGEQYTGVLRMDSVALYEKDDSLHVNILLSVRNQVIERSKALRFIPSLVTADTLVYLPDILVEGTNKKRVRDRWRKSMTPTPLLTLKRDAGIIYRYSYSTPYEAWMDSASFVMNQELTGFNDQRGLITLYFPSGIEWEQKEPYQVQPSLVYLEPAREEKRRKRQGRAYLNFQAGRSVILPEFRNNPEELAKVNQAIEDLRRNPDVEILGLFIEGYASPEGMYATNEQLSRDRATALKEYLRKRFDFPDALFRVSYIAEDWEGVVAALEEGTMDYKEEVLRIIGTIDIFDGRETALMKVGKGTVWRRMVQDLFPALRRVEYQIDYTVRAYTPEESVKLVERSPENLSQQELYRLAMHHGKESPEHTRILLEIIPRLYPDDPVANHNAAALLIERGEYTTAGRYLEKAGDSPSTLHNRGVLQLLLGNLEEARALFEQALAAGIPEARHNIEETEKKQTDDKKRRK